MRSVVLISCVKTKLSYRARVDALYTSTWFRLALQYAKQLRPSDMFVVSAKYGLLPLWREIEPYETTLKSMSVSQRREWANKVLDDLAAVVDLNRTHFVLLAGETYREHLTLRLPHHSVPMKGLSQGRQLSFLKRELSGQAGER